jgi:hypothetical protein
MNAAIYARKSNVDRKEVSIPDQIARCREIVEREGFTLVGFASDEDVSGYETRPIDREGFQQVLDLEPDVIVAYHQDRVARRNEYWQEFRRTHRHVRVLTDDGIDTDRRDRVSESVKATMSEEEARRIANRTLRGRVGALRNGSRVGARDPFGYVTERRFVEHGGRQVVERQFTVNETEAATIERATQLILDEHLPTTEVARLLNAEGRLRRGGKLWSSQELRRVLKNPILAGTFTWRQRRSWEEWDLLVEDQTFSFDVPAIIDRDQFDALQSKLARRSSPKRGRAYPLSGRVVMTCGRHATGFSQTSRYGKLYAYMKCTGIPNSTSAPDTESCGCRMLRADHFEASAWEWTLGQLQDPDPVLGLTGSYGAADETAAVNEELRSLVARERELSRAVQNVLKTSAASGLDTEDIEAATRELTEERETVRRRIETLRPLAVSHKERSARRQRLLDLARMSVKLTTAGPELQTQVYELFNVTGLVQADGTVDWQGDFASVLVADSQNDVLTTSSKTVGLRSIRPAPRVTHASSGSSAARA